MQYYGLGMVVFISRKDDMELTSGLKEREEFAMNNFNNEVYSALVNDLINDAFYLEGASRRGTIAKIRQYAEVIVRKILDLPPKTRVELGDGKLKHQIEERNNPLLLTAVKEINSIGSKCTHTQLIKEITEDDVNNAIKYLFDLYASLLIEFFEKYKFGTNLEIVSSFSILPPIIRYITLDYLYQKYPDNLMVIDKLSLALLKTFDEETALNWIEKRKTLLEKMPSISEEAHEANIEKFGENIANCIAGSAPNMYDLCIERVKSVAGDIGRRGKLYDDFESAIVYYQEVGIVSGSSPDVLNFNSIMEFLYLGRRPKSEIEV